MAEKLDVYEIITNQVVALLEAGTVPWRKPWKGKQCHPANGSSGTHYRGINPFLLEIARQLGGYRDHRWLTFRQAKAAGGSVKKGEKSSIVVFWTWFDGKEIDEKTGKPKKFPCLRYYRVFNVEQTEGCDPAKLKGEADEYAGTPWEAIENAEGITGNWLERSGVALAHGGPQAFYKPAEDRVQMPERERFEIPAEYYSTAFHEFTHSTGHESRLNRLKTTAFGSGPYAQEELVAEMGAAFLCGECGIEAQTIDNSAAYLAGWLKVLKADKRMIATAAAQAQKAVDLILGRQSEAAEKAEEATAAEA